MTTMVLMQVYNRSVGHIRVLHYCQYVKEKYVYVDVDLSKVK
jgi:hypothetical protein